MNITHALDEEITGDRLQAIFDRQRELMVKYHPIESLSGLCQTEDNPLNLNCKKSQARIKDFAWRITEELGEAIDALEHTGISEHFKEELVDGLHFLTELTLLCGWDHDDILDIYPREGYDYLDLLLSQTNGIKGYWNGMYVQEFIQELGMMCNTLKNKPWKQSQMLTDVKAFEEQLSKVWIKYFTFFKAANMPAEDIANVYLKKSQVNAFRQGSKY